MSVRIEHPNFPSELGTLVMMLRSTFGWNPLFLNQEVKIALAQSLVSSSRWLPFDEGARPSFRPRLLDPRASSEVEPKDGPADPRPLRNIIQGADRARGLPAMLPALPCAFLSKRTRARIATLFPSMPPARSRSAPCIPSWQAHPSVP